MLGRNQILNPIFCTVCHTRNQSRQLLGNANYSAWSNYGMCQKCMQHYLNFDNGLLVNEQRIKKLTQFLQKNTNVKQCINLDVRFFLFQQDKQLYQQQLNKKKQQFLIYGFIDQSNRRTCIKCNYSVVLSQATKISYDKCKKCGNKFKINQFVWNLQEDK